MHEIYQIIIKNRTLVRVPSQIAILRVLNQRNQLNSNKKLGTNMIYKINTGIEKGGHGCFAYAPDFKGCHSQGDILEEVLENMKDAIELYIESLSSEGKEDYLNHEIFTRLLEINVAEISMA